MWPATALRDFEKCGVLTGPIADENSYTLTSTTAGDSKTASIHVTSLAVEFFHLVQLGKHVCLKAPWAPKSYTEFTEVTTLSRLRYEDGSQLPAFKSENLFITEDTFLKARAVPISQLGANEKCFLPKGSRVAVKLLSSELATKHSKILVSDTRNPDGSQIEACANFIPLQSGLDEAYLFTPHFSR